jgi:hypothetical protein
MGQLILIIMFQLIENQEQEEQRIFKESIMMLLWLV